MKNNEPQDGWVATHRHRKGGLYREIGRGTYETDRSPVVIYDEAGGAIWVRPASEFDDGRFERLTKETVQDS